MTSPDSDSLPSSWSRVAVASVSPEVDGGRWPVRRSVGERIDVVAGIIIDGHDKIAAEIRYAHNDDARPSTAPLKLRYNDEYVGYFDVTILGRYHYQVLAWVDVIGTWHDQFRRRVDGGESEPELRAELLDGSTYLRAAAKNARSEDRERLLDLASRMELGHIDAGLNEDVVRLGRRWSPRHGLVEGPRVEVEVDPELARFGAWYEFFPRSASETPGKHATLDEAAERLPRIKELGFDIVYLPPIHPIGTTFRKGRDNASTAEPDDPGSPWAIGARDGGHKAVHAELGGIEAFDRFVARAEGLGIKVAIDIAFQTSPDHPYVKEHPEWFRHRPDGTIRYAENPPKKYQDVYPFDFESDDWQALWLELKSIFEFWMDHGVRVFRVDNPHTKSIPFWEWCIGTLRREHPDLIFLSEAFTRPKMMHTLAKLGFNNSYTYFTWRNTREELTEYAQELFHTDTADFFRPNFWPNTPDILHDYLVYGGRAAHIIRFVLAATMSPSYGIYGPPYEHVDNRQHPDREEYSRNEKYEIRHWNWNDSTSLQPLIRRINRIRREHVALQYARNITFHEVDNEAIIAYSKRRGNDLILAVVNLDPHHEQSGWVSFEPQEHGLTPGRAIQVHDLIGDERYLWNGNRHFVRLNPSVMPAHIFHIRHEVSTEQDFPYFQ